ncbi:uncharacterized protein FIESC28_04049 [Fusarium coffeatum]|uniref:C2H2-type domain-containing protein n=1 Tax=Fusarium coffeatum TaxID=231269 RepID=A0A366S192_9HYPO|nr:uncharacterized protein FIESC28_04049 [Fusarium coffeatum]RBR23054.1 hypothetical protein FIESC28_04049 [Fusarium coffeatum]
MLTCIPCGKVFKDFKDLLTHKRIMRDNGSEHIHCSFCGADFKTKEAEAIHIQQYHPKEQNLFCSGCGKGPFARVGGLVAHIQKDCPRIDNETIESLREKKLEFSNALVAATKEPLKSAYGGYMPGASDASSTWGFEESRPFVNDKDAFPTLGAGIGSQMRNKENVRENINSGSGPQVNSKGKEKANDWNQGKNLFPDAPAAQKPTQQQLDQATAPNARDAYGLMSIHNPSHPNFNVGRYACQFTGKYNCPVASCTKTFKSGPALLGHLKSEAHSETKYRCPYCLNTFNSLTAIVQHAESNGVKCKIREMDNFRPYLDQLLAGLVDVKTEKNKDGTLQFVVAKDFTRPGQQSAPAPKREYKHEDIKW